MYALRSFFLLEMLAECRWETHNLTPHLSPLNNKCYIRMYLRWCTLLRNRKTHKQPRENLATNLTGRKKYTLRWVFRDRFSAFMLKNGITDNATMASNISHLVQRQRSIPENREVWLSAVNRMQSWVAGFPHRKSALNQGRLNACVSTTSKH